MLNKIRHSKLTITVAGLKMNETINNIKRVCDIPKHSMYELNYRYNSVL